MVLKGCDRASPCRPGSLPLPPVFGTKTRQEVEACYRPEGLEQGYRLSDVFHGNARAYPRSYETDGLGSVDRFIGRLLPHSITPKVPENFDFLSSRNTLAVQGSAIRFVHIPLDIHQGHGGGEYSGGGVWGYHTQVHRRLAHQGAIVRGRTKPLRVGSSPLLQAGSPVGEVARITGSD